ncbi:alix V-shaped domain binding to HIV protein (macronuclear) [Tetrahymena thermophila SB210]|uniref:Alix V-shaped domain binding to HIV protein n=1 Tax=Tetrahymena thermophila (strain SB210) TaxID=312017 RepID=I7MKI8_TETTS|nr:alix V-shaped domain binding to HIV protein [Tetrahymena thermophila SB210]EAR99350.3 alix V-shaped domain binding to HIV protein [Tetrahymena thermophila SB210]|eukprot:XP_001019595.3 alix V-shaped domain binding to HIV protein [Tetrahymena thermophila SB210]
MSFITYPLKVTGPIPIDVIFEQFITQIYGEATWQPVKGLFTKVSQLRGEFLFDQHNLTVANDPATCAKLVEKLTLYYKHLLFLQNKFRFEYYQPGAVNIPFQWSNSFDAKKQIATPSLVLEKACILYNLTIIYYTEGNNLMFGNPEQRKVATQKFRFGLWCIQQIKQLVINMAPEIKAILTDFCEANLDILYHTMLGNCYAVLFNNLLPQEDQIKVKNIASLAGEASQNYTIALSKVNGIIQSGEHIIPQDHLQKVKAFLFFNTVKYMAIAGLKMSKHHKDLHEDNLTAGHIGWALGYVKNSVNTITIALKNEAAMKFVEKQQQDQLQQIRADCEKEFNELNQRNLQIYNQEVIDEKKLPRTTLMEQLIIQPAEPKEMQQNIAVDESAFANFVSEETLQMVQEIKQFAQQRCNEVENVQKQIFDMKQSAYLENYVNFFIDLISQKQQQQIPQKVNDKIAKFNSQGGTKQLKNFIQTLKDNNIQCGMIINNVRQKLEKEQSEDDTFRKDYGAKWTRAQSSTSNKEYLNELKNLEENFKIATNVDMDTQQRWQQNLEVAELMEKPPAEYTKYFVSGSSEDSFKQQNLQLLQQLENTDTQINSDMTAIKDSIQNINNSIRNTNFQGEVSKVLQQKVPKDKVLETVLQPVSLQITALNDMIAHYSNKVSEACNLAIELQQKRNQKGGNQSGNMQQSEKYSGGLTTLVELFDDCQQGMKFYGDLLGLLLDLDKKVSDFISAREIEKNNLIQMIHNEQSKVNMNQGGFNAQYVQPQAPPTNYFYGQQNNPYNQYPPQNQYPPSQYPPQNYGAPYQNHPYQQHQQQQQMPQQSNPFYNNGQFNQGQSVFIPKK